MTPSIETLKRISTLDDASATELRHILSIQDKDDLNDAVQGYNCYAQLRYSFGSSVDYIKLLIANEIINGHGIEGVAAGSNRRSPAFEYINMGDSYDSTLVYINGKFRVTTWGDIVERGNYA